MEYRLSSRDIGFVIFRRFEGLCRFALRCSGGGVMTGLFFYFNRTMLKNKFRLVSPTAMLGGFIMASASIAFGQVQPSLSVAAKPKFSLASIRGDYPIVGTFSGHVAIELGNQTIDGRGHFTGSSVVNVPGADGKRRIIPVTFTGTYTVTSDGKGTDSFTVPLPNGTTATFTEDFIITKAEFIHGELIATEIVAAMREPSAVVPGGVLLTHVYTRRPN